MAVFSTSNLACCLSHDAQECFCDEPNCVGYIGGKTQTDIGVMDDLYLEGVFPFRLNS